MPLTEHEKITSDLQSLVDEGVLVRFDFVDEGDHWLLTRNSDGPAYHFTGDQVRAYLAGVRDGTDGA